VLRNPSNYFAQLPNFTSTSYDGALIRNDLCPDFLDLANDNLDTTTHVDDVVKPVDPEDEGATGEGAWLQQGSTWRQQMEDFGQLSGAVWYISPDRALHYHALDEAVAPWGFSDTPNGSTTIGPREVRLDEDGSVIVNDALIWGGSEWAGSGQVVFAREENTTSITNHGRWQLAEHHFGERWYKTQRGVDARANVIVNGAPGSVAGADPNRGLRFAQKQLDLAWFAHDVPSNQHLVPGMLVTTDLNVFDITTLILPLRRIRITFPTLSSMSGDAYVRFDGSLSLQLTDPKFWWDYIRKLRRQQNSILATASSSSTTAVYGTYFSGELTPNPDGAQTVFTINPSTFSYIAGTTQVYLNGVLQTRGAHYTESDPDTGQLTFASAPAASANLWLICRLA